MALFSTPRHLPLPFYPIPSLGLLGNRLVLCDVFPATIWSTRPLLRSVYFGAQFSTSCQQTRSCPTSHFQSLHHFSSIVIFANSCQSQLIGTYSTHRWYRRLPIFISSPLNHLSRLKRFDRLNHLHCPSTLSYHNANYLSSQTTQTTLPYGQHSTQDVLGYCCAFWWRWRMGLWTCCHFR